MPHGLAHLSLFSGIGGFDLAAEWAGFTTIGMCERDAFCRRVLARHWPFVPLWRDVADITAGCIGGPVALVTGGFPCQPHSVAGRRGASADERDLWHHCARIVGFARPRWCVFENVPGLLSSENGTFFGRVLGDLAALGFVVTWFTFGACDVGAPHQRDRVFLVAHADQPRPQGRQRAVVRERGSERAARAGSAWRAGPDGLQWGAEPAVGRVATRVPRRVDRLRALGNAVVPAHVYPLLKCIADQEERA